MIQKCNYLRVLEVFFIEPTMIHFIKEISKKIALAPVSVRNYIEDLQNENLIRKKEAKPFNGFVANRESEKFTFYKKVYNIYTLRELTEFLVSEYYPKVIIVFGSYSRGEDVESSDIDLFLLSKSKKDVELKIFEKKLHREIHVIAVNDVKKLDNKLIKKIYGGVTLYGSF